MSPLALNPRTEIMQKALQEQTARHPPALNPHTDNTRNATSQGRVLKMSLTAIHTQNSGAGNISGIRMPCAASCLLPFVGAYEGVLCEFFRPRNRRYHHDCSASAHLEENMSVVNKLMLQILIVNFGKRDQNKSRGQIQHHGIFQERESPSHNVAALAFSWNGVAQHATSGHCEITVENTTAGIESLLNMQEVGIMDSLLGKGTARVKHCSHRAKGTDSISCRVLQIHRQVHLVWARPTKHPRG
jgi:hypothetical protein